VATREKKAAPKGQQQTEYVILRRDSPESGWLEYGVEKAQSGSGAIKKASAMTDGSNEGGEYKAVARSTWESESNNLTIVTETKKVTSFLSPRKGANGNGHAAAE
jgi:hypothetical protein